jgi:hypothetical protein
MNWLKKTYRTVINHLTKVLGIVGTALMSTVAWIDPDTVRAAAQTYLGQHAFEKIGAFLFALVIVRGWYTGKKAQQPSSQPRQ